MYKLKKIKPKTEAINRSNDGQGVILSVAQDCMNWCPEPLSTPEIDERMLEWDVLSQAGETVRFQTSRLEYWLSPTGVLRCYIKACIKTGIYLCLLGLVMIPLAMVFHLAAECVAVVLAAAKSLLEAVMVLIATFFLLRFLGVILKNIKCQQRAREEDFEY
jgi:uncharacterized membrane protein